jgi:hypothetical protein
MRHIIFYNHHEIALKINKFERREEFLNWFNPIAMGCFICADINFVIILIDKSSFVISGGILFKILVLGINEMVYKPFL